MQERMRALLHTEFTALLARAGVTQAGFARLACLTPRQVNNWARGRAAVPTWAALLLVALDELTPDGLETMVEDAEFAGTRPSASRPMRTWPRSAAP